MFGVNVQICLEIVSDRKSAISTHCNHSDFPLLNTRALVSMLILGDAVSGISLCLKEA